MSRLSMLAIHGVGNMKQGAVLDELHLGLSKIGIFQSAARNELVVDNVVFDRLVPTARSEPFVEVIEVSWTDVQRPSITLLGALRHLFFLVLALLQLCSVNSTGRLYRVVFETLFVWCIFPPIVLMLLTSNSGYQWEIATASVAVVFLLTCFLQRFSPLFWAGIFWAAGVALLSYFFIESNQTDPKFIQRTTDVYFSIQVLTAVVGALAAGEILYQLRKHKTVPFVLTRLAFVYAPGFAVSALGALLLGLALLVTKQLAGDPDTWAKVFVDTAPYHVAAVEYTVATAIAFPAFVGLTGVGFYLFWSLGEQLTGDREAPRAEPLNHPVLLPIAALLVVTPIAPAAAFAYFFFNVRLVTAILAAIPVALVPIVVFSGFLMFGLSQKAGEFARNWLLFVLILWPILVLAGAVLIGLDAAIADFAGPRFEDEPISVYQASVLRLLPYLAFLVGPLVISLDAAGDVLFYLLPNGPLSTTERTRSRLETAIHRASGDEVLLMAHSQGSVIAEDLITANRSDKPIRLLTFGSPITALYKRFLDSTTESRTGSAPRDPKTWTNICRTGDFIGGAVDRIEDNRWPGPGGHTGYWSDRAFMEMASTVWQATDGPSRPASPECAFCRQKRCECRPSRRVLKLIQKLRSDASKAAYDSKWADLKSRALSILALAPSDCDAQAYLKLANQNLTGAVAASADNSGPTPENQLKWALDDQTGNLFKINREGPFATFVAMLAWIYFLAVFAFLVFMLVDTWAGQHRLLDHLGFNIVDRPPGETEARFDSNTYRLLAYSAIGGAFGGTIDGFRSLITWNAEREAYGPRFFAKDVALPWIGGAVGVFVYIAIRAGTGILSGDVSLNADTRLARLSAFSLAVVAGFSSRQVFRWLDDRANKMFKVEAGRSRAVPDVIGMSRDDAEKTFVSLGLKLGGQEDIGYPEGDANIGKIVSQDPKAGTVLEKAADDKVKVTIGVKKAEEPKGLLPRLWRAVAGFIHNLALWH